MSHEPSSGTHKPLGHRAKIFLILVAFVAVGVWGVVSRVEAEKALDAATKEQAIPSVAVIEAESGPDGEDIVLPGTVQAWHEAPIYARTNGYLKSWAVDIGAHVKTGDALAEIDTPEVDAQLQQAVADLATAQANDQLAQTTLKRWQVLFQTHSVSKQDLDDKAGAASADDALVASAQANLDRLHQLEDFKHVTAPFDGIITARNTDVGALINAGSGSAAGVELFHIAETDKLRVYVQVPENYTSAVKPDMTVELYFPAYPQRTFPGTLTHMADAIDPVTRTLLIELEVDNAKGELMSGGYAEAHITLKASGGNIRLPVNTLLFRDGMQVATVGDDGRAILKRITIGRDYGKSVEVLAGLAAGEKVIVNPPDSLSAGQEVKVVTPDDGKDGDSDDAKDGNKKDDGKE